MPQHDLLDEVFESGMDPFDGGYANAPFGSEYANAPLGSEYADAPISDYGHTPAHVPGGAHVGPAGSGSDYGHTPSNVRDGGAYGVRIPVGGGDYGHTPSNVRGGSPAPAPHQTHRSASAFDDGHGGGGVSTLAMHERYKYEAQRRDSSGHVMKYVADAEERWRKYGVTIGRPMFRRGGVFDSEEVKIHFAAKHADTFGYGSAISGSTFGKSARTGRDFDWPMEWAHKGVIWICMTHPMTGRVQFYSHVGKRRPDNQSGYHFGHSSLSAGSSVIGAGEWIVEKGTLKSVSANSGHYQPTIASLHQAMQSMIGAISEQTTVYLYDKVEDRWDYRDAFDFLDSPTGGGRYWAHPRAQG